MVVDMAYPLMVYAVVLMGEFLIRLFQTTFLTQVVSIFLLLYGMLMTFDLISLIFMTAYTLLAIQASKTP
jgi:C4-dicarboxylate transporter